MEAMRMYQKSLYRPHPPVMVRVRRIEPVSKNLVRITFHSRKLGHFPSFCPGAHIKVFLPLRGQTEPVLPVLTDKGPRWPESIHLKPVVRTYSVREFHPGQGEISLEFSLHRPWGPASEFAHQAKVDDLVGLTYPGGPDPMIIPAKNFLFVADLSSLPALSAILEHLPDEAAGRVLIRIHDPEDIRILKHPPGISVSWFGEEALKDIQAEIPESRAFKEATASYFWIAGEHALVLGAHRTLMKQNIPKDRIYAVPYWRKRNSEESYHHLRHQIMEEFQ